MVELNLINFDKSPDSSYKFLDLRFFAGRKFTCFTLIYAEDRLAIVGVTNNRKDILGSFSMQGSGHSEQKIIKII